jgi:hypothetical protein
MSDQEGLPRSVLYNFDPMGAYSPPFCTNCVRSFRIQAFSHTPTAADWTRFAPYARRVRSLIYRATPYRSLSEDLLNELARTRTSHRIFPNLHTLHWLATDNHRSEELFMHEGIRELRVRLVRRWDAVGLDGFAASVTERTPMLTTIYIEHTPAPDLTPLSKMIAGLERLERVTLPLNLLADGILARLGTLPKLRIIEFVPSSDDYSRYMDHPPISYMAPEMNSFPALEDLSLCSSIEHMKQFLIDGALLPKLSNLYLISQSIEQPSSVQDLFGALATRYPGLKRLAIDIIADVDQAFDKACEPLTFETLRPLLALSSLVALDVRHNLPLTLTSDEISTLGTALPALRELGLNCEPLTAECPPTTLAVLPALARAFPRLETLRLFIDAATPPPCAEASAARFRCLREVHFGLSPISEDVGPAELFLSRIFAEGKGGAPTITAGITWDRELYDADEELVAAMHTFWRRWEDVRRRLPLLVTLRRDEMSTRAALVREVEDLRMRSAVLEGRAQLHGAVAAEGGRPCVVM